MPQDRKIARAAVSSAVYSIDKAYDYEIPDRWQDIARPGQRVIVPFGTGNRKAEGVIFEVVTACDDRPLKPLAHLFDDEFTLSPDELSLALWMKKRYFCTLFEAACAFFPPGVWNKGQEVYVPGPLPLDEALAKAGGGQKARLTEAVYQSQKPFGAAELARQTGIASAPRLLSQLVRSGVLETRVDYQRKVGDKTIKTLRPALPMPQAMEKLGRGKLAEKRKSVLDCLSREGTLPEKELCYLTGVSVATVRTMEKLGLLLAEQHEVYRGPVTAISDEAAPEITLSPEQQNVFEQILRLQDSAQPGAALLRGVTGSGKTLVYIALIRETLKKGKNAILLVPEIALTPQMLRQFTRHFGSTVAVMHSALTAAQRMDEYKRVRSGRARVVVGTRSAVFAPLTNLGIIIIDEEQEPTYSSESAPRYHAAEIAKYRCFKDGGLVLLGSATPSVESYYSAVTGKYALFTLSQRYQDMPLPTACISNMRSALLDGDAALIGPDLRRELEATISRNEQAVLFINRRGSARMAVCIDCGYVPECQNCSVALTYHSRNGRLMCHHCGFSIPLEHTCPVCGSEHIRLVGAGTQKVEEELYALFPDVRVIRMDADTTTGRTTHEKLLDSFAKGGADILLGTQMVAKGLDFDNVTLVGVLDADLSLYCGDYHAQERTFSLLAQVVGRAGRRNKPGRAVIQTYHPDHPVILTAAAQDYQSFFEYEIKSREALKAPPFDDLFVFQVSAVQENDALRAALRIAGILVKAMQERYADLQTPVLGPAPCAILRLRNKYRYTVSFRSRDSRRVRELVSLALNAFYASPQSRAVTVTAARNPLT